MKIPTQFRCQGCGLIVPIEQALVPPDPKSGKQAEPLPCSKCQSRDWQPA